MALRISERLMFCDQEPLHVYAEGHWDGVMVSGRVYFFRSNQLGILLGAGGWFCLVLHLCCEWGRARQPLLLTTVQTSSQLQVTLVS